MLGANIMDHRPLLKGTTGALVLRMVNYPTQDEVGPFARLFSVPFVTRLLAPCHHQLPPPPISSLRARSAYSHAHAHARLPAHARGAR